MSTFKTFIENCTPLPWTLVKEHPNDWLVGNHSLIINFIRFELIMEAISMYSTSAEKILDVGVYPGTLPQLYHEYCPGPGNYKYYGVGLDFSQEYREKMEGYGVELLECDLEPRLYLNGGRATSIPIDKETVDTIIFTDVIEHFYDPFHPLQEINRVSKLGAVMILTTDNLTRFGSLLSFIRGNSCNVPLIEGNLFYTGDWRPHFREYARDELYQLLQWAGFEVIEHKFYESEFGQYSVVDGRLVKNDPHKLSLIGKLKKLVRNTAIKFVPHLRDNHIIVAKKLKSYEEMLATTPKLTSQTDEWVRQRQLFASKVK
jgi:SAM-dependent methyltransferase